MTDQNDPFKGLDPQEAIDCDGPSATSMPNAGSCFLSTKSHLEKLEAMNLIEMLDDEPAFTKAGLDALPDHGSA
jgi:hypothetical protein